MELEIKSEHKDLNADVAVSPNWCGGCVHRPGCTHLPKRHYIRKLRDIIDEVRDGISRYPCETCNPSFADRRFVYTSTKVPGFYHGDPKCPKLKLTSLYVPFEDMSFLVRSHLMHMGKFTGVCECWKAVFLPTAVPTTSTQPEAKVTFKPGDRIRRSAQGREHLMLAGHPLDAIYVVFALGLEFVVYREGDPSVHYHSPPSDAYLFERVVTPPPRQPPVSLAVPEEA